MVDADMNNFCKFKKKIINFLSIFYSSFVFFPFFSFFLFLFCYFSLLVMGRAIVMAGTFAGHRRGRNGLIQWPLRASWPSPMGWRPSLALNREKKRKERKEKEIEKFIKKFVKIASVCTDHVM